jgi:MoxR-like ATPase
LFIVATQNPIEQEGTYKLPEAQLDRFMMKVKMNYPSLEEEQQILQRFKNDFESKISEDIKKILKKKDLEKCWKLVEQVHIGDDLIKYIAEIIYKTRNKGDIYLGASPRASLSILKASKAIALLNGRDFVIPDDIKYVLNPILNHRIVLMPEKEMEGAEPEDVIAEIVSQIEVPR